MAPAPLAKASLLRWDSRPASAHLVPPPAAPQLAGSRGVLRRLCLHGCEGVGDEVCGQLPLVEELVVAFTAVTGVCALLCMCQATWLGPLPCATVARLRLPSLQPESAPPPPSSPPDKGLAALAAGSPRLRTLVLAKRSFNMWQVGSAPSWPIWVQKTVRRVVRSDASTLAGLFPSLASACRPCCCPTHNSAPLNVHQWKHPYWLPLQTGLWTDAGLAAFKAAAPRVKVVLISC